MMADHQLNGAHYGPSIPPTRPQRRRHNAGCGFCSCILGCFRSCCGCMFNCILSLICRIIATIIILAAIFGFLFWLIVRPNALKFTVTEASLTQFNFTNNNTLQYDLSVKLTIRNPNRRVSVYYNNIETLSFNKDVRFSSQTLGKFFQPHKNTSLLNPVFKGQQVIPLSSSQISEFNKETNNTNNGVYGINLKVLLNVRFALGLIKTGNLKQNHHCDLKVPFKSHNGTSSLGNGFQATRCEWDSKWRLLFR